MHMRRRAKKQTSANTQTSNRFVQSRCCCQCPSINQRRDKSTAQRATSERAAQNRPSRVLRTAMLLRRGHERASARTRKHTISTNALRCVASWRRRRRLWWWRRRRRNANKHTGKSLRCVDRRERATRNKRVRPNKLAPSRVERHNNILLRGEGTDARARAQRRQQHTHQSLKSLCRFAPTQTRAVRAARVPSSLEN